MALDAAGVVRAANRPARDYLALEGEARGHPLGEVLRRHGLEHVGGAVFRLAAGGGRSFEDVEVRVGGRAHRLRLSVRTLDDETGRCFGRVILLREISHEPMQRRFIDAVNEVVGGAGELRPRLEGAREQLRTLREELARSRVESSGMAELGERTSRALTALENWLDVDEALAGQDYPDAQLLQDRMRVATARWPLADEIPERVRELARRVEEYYESGENPRQRVL
jgi:hypothetical protein